MNKKQTLFIFQRREVQIFLIMIGILCFFTFTLGLHLGKDLNTVPSLGIRLENHDPATVTTLPDQIPDPHAITAPGAEALKALNHKLTTDLKAEVLQTGLHLDHPVTVDLPLKTKSPHGGATTLKEHEPLEKK